MAKSTMNVPRDLASKFQKIREILDEQRGTGEHGSHARAATKYIEGLLGVNDLDVSFENFPYPYSDNTKNILIASTFLPLKCGMLASTILPSEFFPRILLCGPKGSELYRETLIKALAKYHGASLLTADIIKVPDKEETSVSAPSKMRRASLRKKSNGNEFAIDELFEVASAESRKGSLILFLKDIEKVKTGNVDSYLTFKRMLESLPKNIVVIGSQTVTRPGAARFTKISNQKATIDIALKAKDDSGKSQDKNTEAQKSMKEISQLFQNKVTIQIPQDETVLEDWRQKLDRDVETMTSQSNIALFSSVLRRVGFACPDIETLCIKDQVLSGEDVEKAIGFALAHYFMDSSDYSVQMTKDSHIVISSESIKYGLDILQGNRDEILKNSLEDVLPDNEFEKKLRAEVSPPGDIGVWFDNIGALENVKETLKETVMLPLQRPELFNKGHLRKPCKGILLFGPPGTGKTMLAKAVATEAGANFINISMSSIASRWYGEAEKYVKAMFTLATKLSPCVIFVDEVDSMLGRRGTSAEGDHTRRMKNEFMVNWDGLRTKDEDRVLVLAATNRPFDLDEAVIRRFPRRLMVSLPDALNREKILKVILATEDLGPDVDLKAIAKLTEGYSGSDLKNLCVAAAHYPIREILNKEKQDKALALTENRPLPSLHRSSDVRRLSMDDFKQACKQVSASVASESQFMIELQEWNELFGEGEPGKKTSSLSYFC